MNPPKRRRTREKFLWFPRRCADGRWRWLTRITVMEQYTTRAYPDYVGGGYELWGWHEYTPALSPLEVILKAANGANESADELYDALDSLTEKPNADSTQASI